MAWPHLDGIIKVVVTYGYNGTPSVNVHFILQRTPVSPIPAAVLLLAANTMRNAIGAEWIPEMALNWEVSNVTAQDWSLPDGDQIQSTGVLPLTGTDAGTAIPASVALVVSHRTDHTGRSRRGRTYLAGLNEGNVSFNDANAESVTAAAEFFSVLDSTLDLEDMDHVVYSLYSDGAPRVTPLATLVTSRIVNNRVDTQRRRLPV